MAPQESLVMMVSSLFSTSPKGLSLTSQSFRDSYTAKFNPTYGTCIVSEESHDMAKLVVNNMLRLMKKTRDLQLQSLMEANHGTRPVDLPLAGQLTKHGQFLYIDKESLQSVDISSMFADLTKMTN